MAELDWRVPSHVEPDQVFDYDYLADPRIGIDVQADLATLHREAPDIFWSPRNGGFWTVTRLDLMSDILRDTRHFSNRELDIPPSNSPNVMIPLNLDPPDHLGYRMALMRHLDRRHVAMMEPRVRHWARELVAGVAERGRCDFLKQIGAAFPVFVFMEMMGLPLDRFDEFRALVVEYYGVGSSDIPRRIAIQNRMIAIIRALFEERKAAPRDDLMSKLLAEEVKGRKLTMEELESIGFLLFQAGLDTVANTLSFTFHFLAGHPDLQARLASDPACHEDFVEEALRRFSIVQQTRIVKQDYDFAGIAFRVGDMVACPLALGGMDDRANADPERFDIDRADRRHVAFSTGPHTCLGNFLARAEMRILVEEWFARIPAFRAAPSQPHWHTGGVFALFDVELEWDL
jgi:cytochrome P450